MMATPEDELRAAMRAHKSGDFGAAEQGYRGVLEAHPSHPKALYYLGLLHFHRGETGTAIDLVRRCLAVAPSSGPAWNTLGSLLITAGLRNEAREAYRRVTLVAPSMGEGWYNLGICLRDEGDVEGALENLRASIAHQPDYFRSHEALATLLYQLGRLPEAAHVYQQWAAGEPQNPVARHMAAATSRQGAPVRAADDYVRTLFDTSASSFDTDLQRLGYRAPGALATALSAAAGGRLLPAVLDAGCGTGLCGPLVRGSCAKLVGVDLSPRMLERARARQCYDELVVAELGELMRTRPSSFDAIISADTLVYFGSLEEPLSAASVALRAGGLLVFTLEASPEDSPDEHRLEIHGRYSHSEQYVRHALAAAGLELHTLSRESFREEREQAVAGLLIVARRA